ncbi:MAG TPA: alpha/beta hydrolase [Bacteroidales bacterium]|nr:alpha/beta hydrolase [Bacteroidales bacterium]
MFASTRFDKHRYNNFEYLKISKENPQAPTLVCLHGMFGGLSNFEAIIDYIEASTIFVPNLPIFAFDSEQLSIGSLSDWLYTFCEDLQITSPVLLGNSLGGHIALDYMLRYPPKVSACILTGSSGIQEKDFGSGFPRRNDREYVREQAAEIFYQDLTSDEMMDDVMKVVTDKSKLAKMLHLARETHEYCMKGRLSEIKQEILLVWGKNDTITPPSVAHKFEQLLPNVRLRWIDRCGHAPMMEHPQKFAYFANEFLTDIQQKRNRQTISDYEENYSHH